MNSVDMRLMNPVFYKELVNRCLNDFKKRMAIEYPDGRDKKGNYFYFDKDSLRINLYSVDIDRAINDSSYVPSYMDPSFVLSPHKIEDAEDFDISINSFESKSGFMVIRPIDSKINIKENRSHNKDINRDIKMALVYANPERIILYHKDSIIHFVGSYSLIHESKIIGSLTR